MKEKIHESQKEITHNKMNLMDDLEKSLQANKNEVSIIEILEKFKVIIIFINFFLKLKLQFFNEIDTNEKTQTIEYFFEQILELMIPIHMRYLMWISANGNSFFYLLQKKLNKDRELFQKEGFNQENK